RLFDGLAADLERGRQSAEVYGELFGEQRELFGQLVPGKPLQAIQYLTLKKFLDACISYGLQPVGDVDAVFAGPRTQLLPVGDDQHNREWPPVSDHGGLRDVGRKRGVVLDRLRRNVFSACRND